MALNDAAIWELQAPSGETITGLGTLGGRYHSSDGWASGWTVNGTYLGDDPLPANEACTAQNHLDACTETSSGWVTVPNASSIDLIIYCAASSTASTTRCHNDPSDVSADVTTAVVQLRDPSSPAISTDGSLWQAATGAGLSDGWISGINAGSSLGLSYSATNPAGICRLEAALTDPAGAVVASSVAVSDNPATDSKTGSKLSTTAPFGSTLPCGGPASGTTEFAPDLSKLPTGIYYLNVEAQDPAEWQSGAETYATGASLAGGYPIAIDNTLPTVSISTGTSAGSWYPSGQTATVTADDQAGTSGLQSLTCDVNGVNRSYRLSGDHATVSIPLTATGANQLACSAESAAGNVSSTQTATVSIDGQRPTVSFSGAAPAPSWSTSSQRVTVTAAEPTALSGIASTSCALDGGVANTVDGATQSVTIDGDGVHRLVCTATTGAGVTGAAASYTVQIDSQAPDVSFSGPAPAPAWLSGTQVVDVHTTEPTQLSGIASTSCRVDGGSWVVAAGDTQDITVAGNGSHTVTCRATSVSGMTGPDVSETLQLDDDPPSLTLTDGPTQGTWYDTTQTVDASAVALGGTDLAAIDCSLGGAAKDYPASAGATTEAIEIRVPAPGGDLVCNAIDTAGNRSADASWSFEIDDTAPTGVFESPNPERPAQVAVHVADAGSGVSSVQVQVDEARGWTDLPTTFDRATGIATASVPDDGSLPDGSYAVRALVSDRAGNTATIANAVGGVAETITLPLRELTTLSATVSSGSRHVASASAGRPRAILRIGPASTIHVAGRLTAPGGVPVAGAPIALSEQVSGRGRIRRLAQQRTNSAGGFLFTTHVGPSCVLIVSFAGSRLLRTTSARTRIQVRGRAYLVVPRVVRPGHRTTITGRVLGGYIPAGGALVQLWYRIRRKGDAWEPFERAIRTRSDGRFQITFPVSRAAGGLPYSFRAVVARQAGWPYLATTSNVVSRRFR